MSATGTAGIEAAEARVAAMLGVTLDAFRQMPDGERIAMIDARLMIVNARLRATR